jgi:hypothetical protein
METDTNFHFYPTINSNDIIKSIPLMARTVPMEDTAILIIGCFVILNLLTHSFDTVIIMPGTS